MPLINALQSLKLRPASRISPSFQLVEPALTGRAAWRETQGARRLGGARNVTPIGPLFLWRMLVAAAAASVVPALPGLAQQPAAPAQPDSPKRDSVTPEAAAPDSARLDAIRLTLDRADATFRREGLSVQALFDLGQGLAPLRDELQARIDELEPRLAGVDARLKQLGPPPAIPLASMLPPR
jgi:small-conductance mechanosensitive channel